MNVREGKKVENKKKRFPLPFLLFCESLVTIKENTDRKIEKRRKKERKKERKKIRIEYKSNSTLLT